MKRDSEKTLGKTANLGRESERGKKGRKTDGEREERKERAGGGLALEEGSTFSPLPLF